MKIIKISFFILLTIILVSPISAQNDDLYFSKKLDLSFTETLEKVKTEFNNQGFGVVTEIKMDEKIKEKFPDTKTKAYTILGLCNVAYAYKLLQKENNIGLLLPCKAIVKDLGNGKSEVVVVNPSSMLGYLQNDELKKTTKELSKKFKIAMDKL